MTPGIAGGSIQLSSRPVVGLRPGDSVVLTVLKALAPGKWAVGIGGRVFPAFSELDLSPGTILRARVGAAAGRVVLTVEKGLADPVALALQKQGLPDTPLTQLIAGSLLRAGRPVLLEVVERMKAVLSRSRLDPRKAARIAATLVDKKIDLTSPGLDALMSLLAFGEKGGSDPRRYRGRPFPGTAAELRELAAAPAHEPGAPDGLQVFNHSRGSSLTWVVVPFLFSMGDERIAGAMKFLYDSYASRLRRFVLSSGGLSFCVSLEGRARRLSIFCDEEPIRRASSRRLDTLRAKFHNMGMEVDDTIHEGELFDGFSPAWEGASLRSVDAVG
ncbi:MAG: hypothetical protein NT005_07235 [Spirochaetes bacterium]|nr:hypothetical protein [Spirochaetota bacterium]